MIALAAPNTRRACVGSSVSFGFWGEHLSLAPPIRSMEGKVSACGALDGEAEGAEAVLGDGAR